MVTQSVGRDSDSLRAGRSADRILVQARFSAPVQTGPGAHPASYKTGTGSFPGIKRPRRGVNHPSHLAPRLKNRAIPLLPLCAFMTSNRVNFTLQQQINFSTTLCDFLTSQLLTVLLKLKQTFCSQTIFVEN
jgi:hypothetical protein